MSKPTEIESKVREMALLSVFSDKINPIQEQNIRMYPFVFFESISDFRCEYDFSRKTAKDEPVKNGNVIAYYFNIVPEDNDNVETRCKHLEASIRNLLWNDIKVKIYFNDRMVYESV